MTITHTNGSATVIKEEENPFESMLSRFQEAASILDIDEDTNKILVSPAKEVKVNLTVKMDNGRVQVFE